MIAALYVQTNGAYFGVDGVDPWDMPRNAMCYTGPHAVVAHPPCSRWCRLAGFVEKQYGHKIGDDGGTFAHALSTVRVCGGVLEHPAHSKAWPAFGLPKPDRRGGWSTPDAFGCRTCHVEQRHYGHRARKATWLYAKSKAPLPELQWGPGPEPAAVVGSYSKAGGKIVRGSVERMGKRESSATPLAFKRVLLEIAYWAELTRLFP